MRRLLVSICVLAGSAVAVLSAGAATPPPGASALCRDGTYSFSTHHSGTCSHHGGVARWLDAGGGGAATATAQVGRTIALGRRSRTSGCTLGALPDRRCSPGAVYSGLTRAVLCSPSFRTGSIRSVSESTRHAVELEYGLPARSYGGALEIDHVVPLELGGSNALANLYPERAPGFHAKDRLENRAHALVCAGTLALDAAQRAIASDWQALYERVFDAAPTVRR